jgi:phospholipid/cholesterol/gamma-HCH transport system substrate-binding protein
MITTRTKIQLIVFVLITLIGVSYAGAKYARLDRLVFDDSYRVVAHFKDSGGIFDGAEVTYRGITVGQVGDLEVTESGVDVGIDVDNDSDPIPADATALVANRSAVGEQFIDLQPQSDSAPYLKEGSEIATEKTTIPISTTELLVNLDTTVRSVNRDSLRTVVDEMGKAFKGTGQDISRLIDTSNSFIRTANENFEVTTSLIQDSNIVLNTQLDSASAIRSFSKDLALFSDTVADSDPDLRTVIDSGSATANQLRTFLEQNEVNLGRLINNLVTTGEIQLAHLDGIEQVLVLYPYVVSGGFTVVAKDPDTGLYDAHFGMITQQNPHVCTRGYNTRVRTPQERADIPMNFAARCAEPQALSSSRGAQHHPRPGTAYRGAPVVAAYDPQTGRLRYTDHNPDASVSYTGGAATAFGKDSWKWLLVQPLAEPEE